MSKLEALTGKTHLSYSALDSFLTCGERYRLERVEQVPEEKAWWFVGGNAVHHATELLDTTTLTPGEAWESGWTLATQHITDDSEVRAGGRATKQWPNKENRDWWETNGLQMVADYAEWRKGIGAEWDLLLIEGQPAVEVPFTITLGGVEVKGFVDRVFVNGNGEAVVTDIKTGSRTPAATSQLGIYALGVEKTLGIRPTLGNYYMARKGETSQVFALAHYTEALLTDWFVKVRTAIEQELFLPHVTSMCQTCSVSRYCYAVGGTPPKPLAFKTSIAS